MADVDITYGGDASRLVQAHQAIEASGKAANVVVTELIKNIKLLDRTVASSKINDLAAKINAVTASLGALTPSATTANAALTGVGAGTTKIATTATKLKTLNAALNGTTAAAGAAGTAVAGVGAGTQLPTATSQSNALATSFRRTIAAGLLFRGVKKVIGEVGDALREAREHTEKMGDQSLDRKKSTRELASLMGVEAGGPEVMARVFGTGMASGMGFDESRKFQEQFEGSITAGEKKGNIKKSQYGEVSKVVALAAQRFGLDAATAGDMAGTIAADVDLNAQVDTKTGKKMTPAQAMSAQMEAMAYGLNEGRGKISTLARGEVATAAREIGAGRVRQRSDIGAIVGTGSQAGAKSGASAGTFSMWADRGLNRVGKGAGEFLESSGVNKERYFEDKLSRMKVVLDEAREASPDPKAFDPNKFLATKGFGSEQDRMAIIGFVGKLDVLNKRLVESRRIAADPSIAAGRNATYQATDVFQASKAELLMEEAEDVTGRKQAPTQIARKRAAARLERQGLLNDPGQKVADAVKGGFGLKQWAGLQPELQKRIDDEARKPIEVGLKNAGIDPVAAGITEEGSDGTVGPIDIGKGIAALKAKGMNPYGGDAGAAGEAERQDTHAAQKAKWDAAKLPQPRGALVPARPPGAVVPGAAGAAGAAGPQASLDAADFKTGVAEFRAAIMAMGNGGGATQTTGRGARDIGSPAEFVDAYVPHRAGSFA